MLEPGVHRQVEQGGGIIPASGFGIRRPVPLHFRAYLHIDETHALEPLETWAHDEADLPETYPTAL
jgi:hypothetical protein